MAVAMTGLAACSSNDDLNESASQEVTIVAHLMPMNPSEDSRTEITGIEDDNSAVNVGFSSGDLIGILTSNGHKGFRMDSESEDGKYVFTGVVTGDIKGAYYPFSSTGSATSVEVSIGDQVASYKASDGTIVSNISATDIKVGVTTERTDQEYVYDVDFYHLASMLCFTIDVTGCSAFTNSNSLTSVVLSNERNGNVNEGNWMGTFTFNPSDGEDAKLEGSSTPESQSLTITLGDAGFYETTSDNKRVVTFYAMIAPGLKQNDTLTITLTLDNSDTVSVTIPIQQTMAKGKLYNIPLTMSIAERNPTTYSYVHNSNNSNIGNDGDS